MAKKKPSGLRPHHNTGPRIKRNQPCPCGSGVKAKRCCLKQVQAMTALPEHMRERFLADGIFLGVPVGTIEEPVIEEPVVEVTDCKLEVSQEEQQT